MPDTPRREPKVLVSTENLTEQEWLACRTVDDQLWQPHGGHSGTGCWYGRSYLRYADTAGHAAAPQG